MTRVYAYLRASTDRQDASVPAQREAIVQFCEREQMEVIQWFADDGVSGKSFERAGYRRMRALVVGGNPDAVDHVVVWSLSRFARVAADDFVVEKRTLARGGVTIVSATEAIRGHGDMGDSLLSYISAHQNREFLVKLSKDVTRGLRMLVNKGFWPSVAPLGYNRLVVDSAHRPVVVNDKPLVLKRGALKGNQNHVVLIPGEGHEQNAVRFMFEKRVTKMMGLREIAAALNDMGVRTIYGGLWKQTTVRSCLTNIAYLGHTRYGIRRKHHGIRNQVEGVERKRNPKEEWITVENTHEPLISVGIFQQVQDMFVRRGVQSDVALGGRRRLMLFTSMITCGHCGARYHCAPKMKNGKRYEYYVCSGRSSGRTQRRCDCWSVNAQKLKQFIFGEIQRRVSDKEFETALRAYLIGRIGQLLRGEVLDTRQIDKGISEIEGKKRRVLDSIADGLVERGDLTVAEKLAELNEQMLLLNSRRQEILKILGVNLDPDEIAARLIERVRDVASLLDSRSIEDQRRVLMAFCHRIVADAESKEIVVEADLTGIAQNETLPGLPAGLSVSAFPAHGAGVIQQPALADGLPDLTLPE